MIHSVAPRVFLEREGEMLICIFCGSSCGNNELYADAARQMGRTLARRRIDLVYGRVGLMGALAEAALISDGTVIGVMPQSLVEREIQHTTLSKLHIVATMHERKTKMAELADGFIALPGGAGAFRRDLRAVDLGATRHSPKAMRLFEYEWLFRPFAENDRPDGGPRLSATGTRFDACIRY